MCSWCDRAWCCRTGYTRRFTGEPLHEGCRSSGPMFKEEPAEPLSTGQADDPTVCEQLRGHHGPQGFGRHLPVQMVSEQRRRLRMTGGPYEDGDTREERRVLVGMSLPAQSPLVSMNLHHILTKRGSFPSGSYALSHLAESCGYGRDEMNPYLYRTQSPTSSPSPEGHCVPHYIGTSVIISHERWRRRKDKVLKTLNVMFYVNFLCKICRYSVHI